MDFSRIKRTSIFDRKSLVNEQENVGVAEFTRFVQGFLERVARPFKSQRLAGPRSRNLRREREAQGDSLHDGSAFNQSGIVAMDCRGG